ncbi:MAG TPA: S8 family serine peptidase [Saprospiraceae bacterium]|nr:S8 family serine peptidase [Saprospiraceae bacterium]HMP24359.1 S8 family serine peptidase [Saprospiraceae bacterium]
MHKFTITTLLLAGLLANQAFAQSDYGIYLQSGVIPIPEMLAPGELDTNGLANCHFQEHYHLIIQFYDIPGPEDNANLAALGIELGAYLPNYAFIARVPADIDWSKLSARAIFPLQAAHKMSTALSQGDYPAHLRVASGLRLRVTPYPGVSAADLLESLKRSGFTNGHIEHSGIAITVPESACADLAAHPAVMYIEPAPAPPVPEGWTGVTSHRVNWLHQQGLTGNGVAIAIGDDGALLHEDFRGRVTDFNDSPGGNHGEMTAGVAVGAGNIHPLGVGVAPGASLFMYPIAGYPHLENAVQHFQTSRVVVTSTSYGEDCGGIYDQATQRIDQQIYNHPVLAHFFSAGNSGDKQCSNYSNFSSPDGGRFGNITGGRKAGKNTIAVGNVAYDDRVLLLSSRGPTRDGRIKPDLMGHGQGNFTTDTNNGYRSGGGTSAAAPGVAGTAALLYQAYRNDNAGQDPSSALIKATLLNTAEDLGNPGPDYITGWGRVHGRRALQLLQNRWYQSATATHNATRNHTIQVPAGTQRLRVMLYWHDPEGLALASKALVNDLDLTLQAPDGSSHLPWVLSAAPHRDSLNKPAAPGVDRRNNVEQIVINEPVPGNYTVRVRGHLVPKGPQPYLVVYYFEMEALEIAYPTGGESIVPGETTTLRWDAIGNTGTFSIEYSTNQGTNWQSIANGIAGHLRHYDWQVPGNLQAAQALIRVRRNGAEARSPQPFSIIETPDFNFFYVSQNTAGLRWRSVPGAQSYDVYKLGNQYMEIIGTTQDTNFQMSMASWQGHWFSVRARPAGGVPGRRAVAKWYQHRPCEASLSLRLMFDRYPGETFWDIKDASGYVWMSGGPYVSQAPNSTLQLDFCLPYGCYNLNMYDTYNDGMCCGNGQGSYRLSNAAGQVLASGGQFGNIQSHAFCLEAGTPTTALQIQTGNVRHVSCFGERNGSATVFASGGAGNYTYRWSHGANGATATGLGAGTYWVTVSDAAQNNATAVVTILQPAELAIILQTENGTCAESTGSSITAQVSGGTPPYTYQWSNNRTTATISGLSVGTYQLTVTDANGCTQTAATTLTQASPLRVSLTARNITCAGANDGISTATPTGGTPPYNYAWSNGQNAPSATGLMPGIHSLTVTDSRGCRTTAAVNISTPSAIQLSFNVIHAFGGSNGSIILNVSGGQPGYSFRWSNGATSKDLNNVGPGTYNVNVTDHNGCTAMGSARVEFQDPVNCQAKGSSTRFEWIERVRIGDWAHTSGDNGGYGNFKHLSLPATPGSSYPITLTPGYASSAFREFWRIWIDLNQDGDFLDPGEELFAADGFNTPVNGTIIIPAQALSGRTTLRVSMRYGTPPLPCGSFAYGEVEDYSIVIGPNGNLVPEDQPPVAIPNIRSVHPAQELRPVVSIFPNPTSDAATLRYFSRSTESVQVTIMDVSGKIKAQQLLTAHEGDNETPLDLGHLPGGYYWLRIESALEQFTERLILVR